MCEVPEHLAEDCENQVELMIRRGCTCQCDGLEPTPAPY